TVGPGGLEVLARSTPSMGPPTTIDVAAAKQARARYEAPVRPTAIEEREDSAAGNETGASSEIVVTSESPLLDERRLSTGATVGAEDLASIPTLDQREGAHETVDELQALGYLGN